MVKTDRAVFGPEATGEVRTDCTVLGPEAIAAEVPGELSTLKDAERGAFLAGLLAAEKQFFGDDPDTGARSLESAFARVREHPELLPTSEEDREAAYRALLALAKSVWARQGAQHKSLCRWLAVHMPDRQPSVRLLPPALEAVASDEIVRASETSIEISMPRPEGTSPRDGCRLLVDGRDVGPLPVRSAKLAVGLHAYWVECLGKQQRGERSGSGAEAKHLDVQGTEADRAAGARSWLRRTEIVSGGPLPAPSVAEESAILIERTKDSTSGVSAAPSAGSGAVGAAPSAETGGATSVNAYADAEPDTLAAAAWRLAPSLGVDGVLLLPGDQSDAVVASRYRVFAVSPERVPAREDAPGPAYYVPLESSDLGPGVDWVLASEVAALALVGAGFAGLGVYANIQHNDAVADTNAGYVDRRADAADWEDLSIGGYAAAAAALTAACGLVVYDLLSEDPRPRPFWRVEGKTN